MNRYQNIIRAVCSAAGIFLLILDSRTAITGATDGIRICLQTVIPSLLPFFPLSILLTGALAGIEMKWLRPAGRLMRMPAGSECLFLIGLLGGYPAGAQAVTQCFESKRLNRNQAHRLLGFCSNAGPGFIFGIVGSLFTSPFCAWVLWGIHILSAVLTGILIPGDGGGKIQTNASATDISGAVQKSVRILSAVCAWIILFRVLLAFCNKWFLHILPETASITGTGLLELANGLHQLINAESDATRFILASLFLGFGGLCVFMQTASVTKELGMGWYFLGKVIQGMISTLMAAMISAVLFPGQLPGGAKVISLFSGIIVISVLIISMLTKEKFTVAFSSKIMYNGKKL